MKSGQKVSKDAKCPYYQKHSALCIYCHNLQEDQHAMTVICPNREIRREIMIAYCNRISNYRNCPLYVD